MVFCINCGAKVDQDDNFCEKCGAPTDLQNARANSYNQQNKLNPIPQQAKDDQASQTTVNRANQATVNQANRATVNQAGQTIQANKSNRANQTNNTSNFNNTNQAKFNQNSKQTKSPETLQKSTKKRLKFIIAIIAILVVIAVAACYFINQNRTITVPIIKVTNAQDAVSKLQSQGLKVQVAKEPGRAKKGSFLRLEGVKQGERINSSKPVTVVESLGPGMPKDVIGKALESVTSEVKEMGVPVKVYEVATTSKPGTVVATSPMPGQAFEKSDYSDSMRIAVSANSNKKAIPIDIFGTDKNNAKSKLEKVGINNIELKPRFSSRKLIGKIVGSHPSLGSEVTKKNEKVTLYYGIDAKDTKNSLTIPLDKSSYPDLPPSTRLAVNLGPMAGEWCTNSGKCIYLNEYYPDNDNHSYSGVLLENHPMKLRSVAELPERSFNDDDYLNNRDELSLTNYSQDISGAILYDPKVHTKIQYDTMKNHLLSGDTGAAEFYKGFDLPSCGKLNSFAEAPAGFCVHGKPINSANNPDQFNENGEYLGSQDDISTGLVYRMQDFFVLIPVDAKLEQLEKSGYFRGTGKHTPDLNRPFILRRDPNLYSKTEIPIPDHKWGLGSNPFVPTKYHKAIPFAPAPDDDNAYYKVENKIDWSDFHNAKTL